MHAWNLRDENDHVETPIAKFRAVKETPLPVSRVVSSQASVMLSPFGR